tara:strand:- start:688 stop:1086 length:399 start_codon:yes stop_codon:yes gene_type:complete
MNTENNYKSQIFSSLDNGKLTDKEIKLLQVLFNTPYEKCGDDVTILDEDGGEWSMCWFDFSHYCVKTGFEMNTLKGVVGSLVKKNLIWTECDEYGFTQNNEPEYWIEINNRQNQGVKIGSEVFEEIKNKLKS